MKAWITKYALTKGIFEIDGEVVAANTSIIRYKTSSWTRSFYGDGKDWHHTFDGAIDRAEEMRTAKLKSLEKSMKKIAALNFKEK